MMPTNVLHGQVLRKNKKLPKESEESRGIKLKQLYIEIS